MDQQLIKVVQRLNNKSSKIIYMCNYFKGYTKQKDIKSEIKNKMWRLGKRWTFRMCLSILSWWSLKFSYMNKLLYMILMVTTNQKTCNRYTHKERERNSNIKLKIVLKSQGKRSREEEREELQNKQKTINKIAVNTYLIIITLNVNGLSAPIKRHMVVWI